MTTEAGVQFVEMQVTDVRRRRAEGEPLSGYAVVLQEVGGTRRLLIWIGIFEAEALACLLEHIAFPRPLIYTLTGRVLEATGGRLEEVRVVQLVDTVFYAELVVAGSQGRRTVDARPSDAFNLALVAGVPIHVSSAVLDKAGVPPDDVDAASRPGLDEMRAFLAGSEGAADIVAAAAVLGRPQAPHTASGETSP